MLFKLTFGKESGLVGELSVSILRRVWHGYATGRVQLFSFFHGIELRFMNSHRFLAISFRTKLY